jgi:hypothetical protein
MADLRLKRGKAIADWHLVRWLVLLGRPVPLIDLESWQSLRFWLQASSLFSFHFSVVPADKEAVLEQLTPLLEVGAVVIVDGSAVRNDVTWAVILLADVVLIFSSRTGLISGQQ